MSEFDAPPPRPSTARLSMPPMARLEDLPRPRAISLSFWCWLVAGLLLGAVAGLASTKIDPMRAEFARLARDGDAGATQATIDRVASVSVLIVIGAGVLLGLLGLTLAGAMRAARGWARVILTLVAVLGVAYAAFVISALTDPMLGDLRNPVIAGLLAYAVLVLVALVCMYLPGTTAWLRRPKGS
ncbi:hypothetical protein [Actinophytocola sp.]|uniref:hypothetical protein n=1 Tax=Actinophytocola sp. TaxID=1872138 RepID=UPI003D6A277F